VLTTIAVIDMTSLMDVGAPRSTAWRMMSMASSCRVRSATTPDFHWLRGSASGALD
jgi:hypothetical protein